MQAPAAPAALFMALMSLPEPVLQRIFAVLPVDQRARCACMCRAWRDALADPERWAVLDLTSSSGVSPPRVLACTSRKALRAARVADCASSVDHIED